MNPSPQIRTARRGDREGWLNLRMALWPDAVREELARDIERHFQAPGSVPTLAEAFLLVAGDEVWGMAEVSCRPYAEGCASSPVAYLEGWFVVESRCRQGWGERLLAAVEVWARDRGCTEFASDALIDNAVSRAAHRAAGFDEVEEIVCFRKTL